MNRKLLPSQTYTCIAVQQIHGLVTEARKKATQFDSWDLSCLSVPSTTLHTTLSFPLEFSIYNHFNRQCGVAVRGEPGALGLNPYPGNKLSL